MECFSINLIYFACPSDRKKNPIENVFGKGTAFQRKLSGWSLYLSHSAWANQISSLPVLWVGDFSCPHQIKAFSAVFCSSFNLEMPQFWVKPHHSCCSRRHFQACSSFLFMPQLLLLSWDYTGCCSHVLAELNATNQIGGFQDESGKGSNLVAYQG